LTLRFLASFAESFANFAVKEFDLPSFPGTTNP
jgi:hypothetical protein